MFTAFLHLPDPQALHNQFMGPTEMSSVVSLLAQFTDLLLMQLSKLTQQLPLTASRNAKDPSGTTVASARPDCCVWCNQALVYKGEEKAGHSKLADAVRELGEKMSGSWSVLTMGSLPFIVCYASCGAQLQYYIIMRDTNTALPVSNVFDLHQVCCSWWPLAQSAGYAGAVFSS
jgi:hypothetical protein